MNLCKTTHYDANTEDVLKPLKGPHIKFNNNIVIIWIDWL